MAKDVQPNLRIDAVAANSVKETNKGIGVNNSPRGQVGQSIVGLGTRIDQQNRSGSVEGQIAPGAPGAAESTTN